MHGRLCPHVFRSAENKERWSPRKLASKKGEKRKNERKKGKKKWRGREEGVSAKKNVLNERRTKEAGQEWSEQEGKSRNSLSYATLRVIIVTARSEHELKLMIIRYTVGSFYKCTEVCNAKCSFVCISRLLRALVQPRTTPPHSFSASVLNEISSLTLSSPLRAFYGARCFYCYARLGV